MEKITVRDAYENNLKHLDVDIPLEALTCVTGCSGCGKSSLVFDTIYAESQRAFLEGMTGNIHGHKLMDKPRVGSIQNLRPALNVAQNYYNVNPRSTIGTTSEISYYLRSLFALANSTQQKPVTESFFSSNNPISCCRDCNGLGLESVVSEDLLIPDKEKTLRDGGILLFRGPRDGKAQKYLEALCERYDIDIDRKISELSREELHTLLYANDHVRVKLSYKVGKRCRQHLVDLMGAVPAIQQRIAGQRSNSVTSYSRFMVDVPCRSCGGLKLRKDVLEHTVGGMNYADIEHMELIALREWLRNFNEEWITSSRRDLSRQLIKAALHKLDALLRLNVGYLSLDRSIPSLSGGERQRVRIASQLTCSLRGLLYVLDEPCKGLHYRDVPCVLEATQDLVRDGNTVIAIEHNQQYINAADQTVTMGPVGGPEGGYIIGEVKDNKSLQLSFKPPTVSERSVRVNDIHFRNIVGQSIEFPVGGITCITGVSGSGKSSLATVIAQCFAGSGGACRAAIDGGDSIRRATKVDQSPIGKTPRSTMVSYLGIYDEIRNLFAQTVDARHLGLDASMFSMNIKGGRCECCQGTGLQKIELSYLPSSYITCPACGGNRFDDTVLSVRYNGKSVKDILTRPVAEIASTFDGTKKVASVLQALIDLGLGYLTLGQMSMNLSGGEAQRVKLAKALGSPTNGNDLYILDEPTSGLNHEDIDRFKRLLLSLQRKRDTIVIVEHNPSFVAEMADHVIDFGLERGSAGGKVVAQGPPKDVFQNKASSLYKLDEVFA